MTNTENNRAPSLTARIARPLLRRARTATRSRGCMRSLAAACLAALLAACGGSGQGEGDYTLDEGTQRNVADVLWLERFDRAALPPQSRDTIFAPKNRPDALAARFSDYLNGLLADPSELTPDYRGLYGLMTAQAETSAQQVYAMNTLLGLDSVKGFEPLPPAKAFSWPIDDRVQTEYQVGWHFFVGSVFAETGEEFGVQLMFWSHSLLPPAKAAAAGLSPVENLMSEMHLAVTPVGERHYRARPAVIAGTSGLLKMSDAPVSFEIGRNSMRSRSAESFFPVDLVARGVDRSRAEAVPIGLKLTLRQTKGYVLNGADGMAPSCDGIGTLYYSVPGLQVDPALSEIEVKGKTYKISHGKLWYDHQWATGFVPKGHVRHPSMRALINARFAAGLDTSYPGWDWMFAAFDDDTEMALSALHNTALTSFYDQTGPTPPPVMTVNATATYIDQAGRAQQVPATVRVTDWVRSTASHGEFAATGTWYPDRVEVETAAESIPADKRRFTLRPIVQGGQQGFFAAGIEYSEGAVFVEQDGRVVGRGFLESTGYADNTRQSLELAGIPVTAEAVELVRARDKPDLALAAASAQYWAEHPIEVTDDPGRAGEANVAICRGLL